MRVQIKTLIYLVDLNQNKVALSAKKYGAPKGKPNGYGGVVEPNESIEEGAIRELYEEAKITANPNDLQLVAKILFEFAHIQEDVLLYAFILTTWQGTPQETKEMTTPKWYNFNNLPFDKMWPSDRYFVPLIFEKAPDFSGLVFGRLVFGKDFNVEFYDIKKYLS